VQLFMTTQLTQSHAVSSIVAGWLSKSKAAPAPARATETPALTSLFAPRPERLGLGAKFVPHSAALGVDEQRFSKKLKAAQPAAQQQRQVPKQQKQQRQGSKRREQPSSDSDEDGESRTSAFRLRKGASKSSGIQKKHKKRPS
jgi:hypothetical protein